MFAVGSWTMTLSGDRFYYQNSSAYTAPDQVYLDSGASAAHLTSSFLVTLTNTIAANGMLSFDYSLHLGAPQFPFENYAGYTLNGTQVQLQSGMGSVAIPVTAGDAFGFFSYSGSNCILCNPTPYVGSANITITNFNAPVPEPATTLLLGVGFVLAGIFTRQRARRKRDSSS